MHDMLYKDPQALLAEIIAFVKTLDNITVPFDPQLIDVHFLNTSKELPFLFLDKDVEITPVSLIEVSKN